MDQGSGFISDFRAKRIRTQITWEIYWQTVTRLLRRIRLMRVDGPVPEPVVATRVTKPWRMGEWSRIEFPGINSPGQAPVEHARGFSESRTRLLWSTHLCGARTRLQTRLQWCGWRVVLLEPLARPTFSENPGKISSPSQNPGSHRQGIPGNSGIFASSDGIVRGCTNHGPRTVSCDPAACED